MATLFDDIHSTHCPVIDATSMYNLLSPRVMTYLTCDAKTRAAIDARGAITTNPVRKALQILERMVVHDRIFVDQRALQGLLEGEHPGEELTTPLPPFVEPVLLSQDNYQSLNERVRQSMEVLRSHELRTKLGNPDPDDQYDIECHQLLHKRYGVGWPDSCDSIERAMFYLHLADATSNPVFLSPAKDKWVDQYRSVVAKRVVDLMSEAGMAVDEQVRGEGPFGVVDPGPLPGFPLAAFLLRFANECDTSVLDAAIELRSWEHAVRFRDRLRELYANVEAGTVGQAKVERVLIDLRNCASKWREQADTRLGITRTDVSFQLKAVPLVGPVFDFFSVGSLTLRLPDILLTRRPVLQFMSSLYMADNEIQTIRDKHWMSDNRFVR